MSRVEMGRGGGKFVPDTPITRTRMYLCGITISQNYLSYFSTVHLILQKTLMTSN